MKNDKEFHVLSCDASTDEVSLSWAMCDGATLCMKECAQIQYVRSVTDKRTDRFVPSVEYLRKILGANYHDLGCICCTIGPGSFTGIRNTLAFVKALIAVRKENTPIRAVFVRTHDAIAYQYRNARNCDAPLLVVNDARSNRYYAALYSSCVRFDYQQECESSQDSPEIRDYSADEIHDMLGDYSSLDCVGNASEHIAEMLQSHQDAIHLDLLCDTTCTMIQAVHEIGLVYYKKNIHEIKQFSEPLYIRSAVS